MAVQYAKRLGAEVHALTSPPHLDRVEDLGADHVYDRTDSEWPKALYRNTGKRGVNLCLDSVGQAIWPQLVRALSVSGRLVSYGATTGPEAGFDIRVLFWRQLSLLGTTMGTPEDFRNAMAHVFDGHVRAPLHAVLPLSDIREAHELLEAGQVFGKIVVRPQE